MDYYVYTVHVIRNGLSDPKGKLWRDHPILTSRNAF